MKFNIKILALALAFFTLVSVFTACGESAVTTDTQETDAPKTDAPNTEVVDTDAPEADIPDTNAPESLPVASDPEPEPTYTLLSLDFETELSFADYISEVEGISLNDKLNGGEIKDGKWVYSGKAFAIKDEAGVFSLDSYSLEFDFCFNSFVNKDSTSVFSIITDNDGVLGGESGFYVPLKIDMNGTVYNASAKSFSTQIELQKSYHFKVEIDNTQKKATIYLDGTTVSSAAYSQEPNNYQCFRFMDMDRGTDMWIDNIVITDTGSQKTANAPKTVRAADGAFTRGGMYADIAQGRADGIYIDMKMSADKHTDRQGFLKFDISGLKKDGIGVALMYANFRSLNRDCLFDICLIDSDWDSATLTYNNMPSGEKIIENMKFSEAGSSVDLAPYIKDAVARGDKYFSIRISPANQPTAGQTRLFFTDDNRPEIVIYKETLEKGYFTQLVEDETANKAIWDHAQKMFDEWYERYQDLPEVNKDATLLGRDESQYIKTNYQSSISTNYSTDKTAHKSRPLAALTDLDEYVSEEFKNAKLDKYGGVMVESLKQKATGYFYTIKIEGRWWMIDPLGYPFISIGLSDIHYSQLGSKLQKENALKLYGDYETWALATTRQVRDELNFNNSFRPISDIIAVDGGLPFGASASLMASYGHLKGLDGGGSGNTTFSENNTMPVFDPDFVLYADSWAKTNIKYRCNDRLIGYMSDNELPIDHDMLDRAMSVNHTKEVNFYTYACTWTWLCNMTDKDAPTAADVTDELRDLYRGFVWDRYFYVASAAVKKYDPEHMYLGTRFITEARDSQWIFRFAAQYLDCMTINWYANDWEPDANALYGIAKNGDMPFIVTEFYTKAGDSGLGNTSGAGAYVATQTDRADFYETFTIRMLESPNCVGWQWFQYMDNDPNSGTSDKSSIDSNKGIYRSDFTLYTELTDRMAVLNKNVYNIIDYFKNKNTR